MGSMGEETAKQLLLLGLARSIGNLALPDTAFHLFLILLPLIRISHGLRKLKIVIIWRQSSAHGPWER